MVVLWSFPPLGHSASSSSTQPDPGTAAVAERDSKEETAVLGNTTMVVVGAGNTRTPTNLKLVLLDSVFSMTLISSAINYERNRLSEAI